MNKNHKWTGQDSKFGKSRIGPTYKAQCANCLVVLHTNRKLTTPWNESVKAKGCK